MKSFQVVFNRNLCFMDIKRMENCFSNNLKGKEEINSNNNLNPKGMENVAFICGIKKDDRKRKKVLEEETVLIYQVFLRKLVKRD